MQNNISNNDIIANIQTYNKELKENQNTSILDVEKYLSLFSKLEAIEVSHTEWKEKQKQLEDLQKDFDELVKQNQTRRDDYEKKSKDIQQRKLTYVSGQLTKDIEQDKMLDILKSGVLEYQNVANLIQNNDYIKKQIRDGKYVIARKGNRVALISTAQDTIGYKRELTNFLQQQDNGGVSHVILSNVPVYNNGSHVLSFDKDTQDLPDNVLKIYFSLENNNKLAFVADARKTDLYAGVIEDIVKQLIDHQQQQADGKKVNMQIEGSSYGIAPLLRGVLSAKYSDTQQCLSLDDCKVNLSLIPRSILNGIKPEMIAEKINELFRLAVSAGYSTNKSFVNLDVLSNDHLGRFEYHNVGSTNSFLQELDRLQSDYNVGQDNKKTLLVAVNEAMQPVVKKDAGIIDKSIDFFVGSAKQELFKNIANSKDVYHGMRVRTMDDIANEIESKNTMQNKTAGVNKEQRDGVSHNANIDKNANNGTISATITNDKANKSI